MMITLEDNAAAPTAAAAAAVSEILVSKSGTNLLLKLSQIQHFSEKRRVALFYFSVILKHLKLL